MNHQEQVCITFLEHYVQLVSYTLGMHLYLREQPERTLVLTTSSDDERRGCPRRAMIFRASGPKLASQATVEFIPKEEVDFSDLIRLSARQIQGCLGLINIEHGKRVHLYIFIELSSFLTSWPVPAHYVRNLSGGRDPIYCYWKPKTKC
jgi:hypothetical protein